MEDQDTFTEVTTESWGSRIMSSIKSVLIGVLLFLVAFVVLWFNEGRAVKTARGLTEGASQVVLADAKTVDKNNSGKLVHLTGKVNTLENLKDNEFNIDVNALRLIREVVMYQWIEKADQEKEKQVGGSEKTTTVYNYEKRWSSSIIESSKFKIKEEHINPARFPYSSYTKEASKATMGKFNLSRSMISSLTNSSSYSLQSANTLNHKNAQIVNEGSLNISNGASIVSKVFIGEGTSSSPQIGDVKISFKVVKPNEDYSIIAKQVENTFEPYKTETGTSIQMISKGVLSADNMFSAAQSNNSTMTWILRLLGFLMMFGGLSLIFKPLVVLADVLPFLGNILDFGLSLFSALISFGLSFITIAIAWVVYRPFIGITLLVIGLGVTIFIFTRKRKKQVITNNA